MHQARGVKDKAVLDGGVRNQRCGQGSLRQTWRQRDLQTQRMPGKCTEARLLREARSECDTESALNQKEEERARKVAVKRWRATTTSNCTATCNRATNVVILVHIGSRCFSFYTLVFRFF